MINFYNQVPIIYSAASRDFQYLSWLINIVLNSVKHNIDDMYNLPNNKADPRLAELLALTLGFKIRRSYDQEQLIALVSIIPSILKCKGTERALTLAGNALVRASGAIGTFKVKVENNQIEITFPKGLIDSTLFMDLLPYIAPAGMTCKIVRKTEEPVPTEDIILGYQDAVRAKWYNDVSIDESDKDSDKNIRNKITGLAGLYDVQTEAPVFTNYITKYEYDENNKIIRKYQELNAGLLSNTVIPILENAILEQQPVEVGAKNFNTVSEVEQIVVSELEPETVKEIEEE